MKIPAGQINRCFPELNDIPQKKKEEIVEIARYQTYKKNGGHKKLIWLSIGLGLLIFLIGIGLQQLLNLFALQTDFIISLLAGLAGAMTGLIPYLFYQQSVIKKVRPKALELAEHYRSKEQ